MRVALLVLPALALAACDEPPQEPDPVEPAPMPAELGAGRGASASGTGMNILAGA